MLNLRKELFLLLLELLDVVILEESHSVHHLENPREVHDSRSGDEESTALQEADLQLELVLGESGLSPALFLASS